MFKKRFFVIAILLPVVFVSIIGVITYQISRNIIFDIAVKHHAQITQDTKDNLHFFMTHVQDLSENIVTDPKVRQYLSNTDLKVSDRMIIEEHAFLDRVIFASNQSVGKGRLSFMILGQNDFYHTTGSLKKQISPSQISYRQFKQSVYYQSLQSFHSERRFFISSAESAVDRFSDKFNDVTGDTIFYVSLIQDEQNRTNGALFVIVDPEYIKDLNASAMLIDPPMDEDKQRSASMERMHQQSGYYTDKQGNDSFLIIYDTIPEWEWKLVRQLNLEQLYDQLESLKKAYLYTILGIVVVAVGLTWLLSYFISRFINKFIRWFEMKDHITDLYTSSKSMEQYDGILKKIKIKSLILGSLVLITTSSAIMFTGGSVYFTKDYISGYQDQLNESVMQQMTKKLDLFLSMNVSLLDEIFRSQELQTIFIRRLENQEDSMQTFNQILLNTNFYRYGAVYINFYDVNKQLIYSTSTTMLNDPGMQKLQFNMEGQDGTIKWIDRDKDDLQSQVYILAREFKSFQPDRKGHFPTIGYMTVAFDKSRLKQFSQIRLQDVYTTVMTTDGQVVSKNYDDPDPGVRFELYRLLEQPLREAPWNLASRFPTNDTRKAIQLILLYNLLVILVSILILHNFKQSIVQKYLFPACWSRLT